ncbi:MAG: hypothetical protein NUV91_04865 [Candidatus Omnitrophica bacterium]|nr:hypothetical protein [Candidatus Omnitrophota bacterium]
MFKFLKKMKGQSTLEYAVLIIIVIGALLTIQVYIKRGVQGRLKSATDDIGDQFSPGNTNLTSKTSVRARTQENEGVGGKTSVLLGNETTVTNEFKFIVNAESEFWG